MHKNDEKEPTGTTWISRGFETLCSELAGKCEHAGLDYDVIVVGSGYGGAIAAAEIAGGTVLDDSGMPRPVSVCILERGREYLPGSFPERFSDLPGHVRISMPQSARPAGPREGLFDVRAGDDVNALVANGLGGGSLINAGVMIAPDHAVFNSGWPQAIGQDADLPVFYDLARRMLGAADGDGPNTIGRHAGGLPQKHLALRRLAEGAPARDAFRMTDITVSMRQAENQASVLLNECKRCGDCATGCNHGAKNSLDANLLVTAYRRGAKIFTGATVLRVRKLHVADDEAWSVEVVHTDEKLRKGQRAPLKLKARRIILAAGTFGSTEILLRSRDAGLPLSNMLGQRFSTNGDMIAAGHGHAEAVNAVADEANDPDRREVGPTITGMIDLRRERGLLIQEMAVPGPLRRIFEELVTTSGALHSLAAGNRLEHHAGTPDPHAVDADTIARTAVYAVMGDDQARGVLELVRDDGYAGDGGIRVRWPDLRDDPLFTAQTRTLQDLARDAKLGGQILPNPLWQTLPANMERVLHVDKGPLLTVHPLGGCAMADDCAGGVVDDCGRVFNRAAGSDELPHFKGLIVLDGAIVPRALGANPALTIAALALRAVRKLRTDWNIQAAEPAGDNSGKRLVRPVFKHMETPVAATKTEIQILERMSGQVMLQAPDGSFRPRVVELTLRFQPTAVANLTAPGGGVLHVDQTESAGEPASCIRIFDPDKWEAMVRRPLVDERTKALSWTDPGMPKKLAAGPVTEEMLDSEAELVGALSGTLAVFVREDSDYVADTWRTVWAWLRNRGLRDGYQSAADYMLRFVRGESHIPREKTWNGPGELIRNTWALASHARLARRLEYKLEIGALSQAPAAHAAGIRGGMRLSGHKRLVYSHRANPWRQLQEMSLDAFPAMQADSSAILKLDTRFLANRQWPLLRVVRQQDQPSALADLASLAAYVLRMMATIHTWSFRKPDALPDRKPERLPGAVPGLPPPEIHEIEVDRLPDDAPVHVRTTRYRRENTTLPPIVMIHGYSTSGTTFAHHAIQPNLAVYFWNQGRDVWILDMRTSSGMPTARHPWTFEDVAYADIPAAFNYIYRQVNGDAPATPRKLDVLAHCMGSAMFSMALLKPPEKGDAFALEREELQNRIGKVVLSQVGPVVVFTPDNILRSYLMRYVRQLLPGINYQFRPVSETSIVEQLLDRLLATLPYPDEEFELENPPLWQAFRRTPFTGIRHRMDALYGRDFRLANIAPRTLRYIDDLFGPLSLETVSQVIHFARFQTITNRNGINEFVSRENIARRWKFPTMSVHGVENGLSDVGTLARMQHIFADAGGNFTPLAIPGYGHQDCLIGKDAEKDVYVHINRFLLAEVPEAPVQRQMSPDAQDGQRQVQRQKPAGKQAEPVVQIPWIGPVIAREAAMLAVAATTHPVLGRPTHVAYVPVTHNGDTFSLIGKMDERDSAASSIRIEPLAGTGMNDGWCRTSVDPADWRGIADELLMLFAYPQSSELSRTEFGMLPEPSENDANIKKAIEHYLSGKPCSELESGLIMLPPPASRDARQISASAASVATAASSEEVTFALASCQYPAGMVDSTLAYASCRRLAHLLEQPSSVRKPAFLLQLGDQIYADATAGLFDPTVVDDRFGRRYEELMRNPDVRSVFRRIPVYAMLDDHEIDDNWEPHRGDSAGRRLMKDGRHAYLCFQRSVGPARQEPYMDSVFPLWYPFTENGFPFFILDTRTERTMRSAETIESARIMSAGQFTRLKRWLEEHGGRDVPKFIASPSILLPRLRRAHQDGHPAGALHSDAWDGYPASLHALLAHIADNGIRNVVFLSGDEHLSCHTWASITGPEGHAVEIQSIHSSALYAPYPFANTHIPDLAGEEVFGFSTGSGDEQRRYTCKITTAYAPAGDGFAVIHAARNGSGWQISCDWNREGQ